MKKITKRKFAKALKKVITSKLFISILSAVVIIIIVSFSISDKPFTEKISEIFEVKTVVSIGIAGIITYVVAFIYTIFEKRAEEELKLNKSYNDILKIYNGETVFTNKDNKKYPAVEFIETNTKLEFIVENKEFVLDERISSNITTIMDAHKKSDFKNAHIFRLNDYNIKDNTAIINISPSDQYNTLLTNRVMDFSISKHLTIRDIFEYGPTLIPFNSSKLSNGIGLTSILKTSDGYYVLVKRTSKNPIGKNIYSINNSRLFEFDQYHLRSSWLENNTFSANILIASIRHGISKKIGKFASDDFDKNLKYTLLGGIRDLIEGGKPELIYLYESLLTKEEITNKRLECSTKDLKEEGISRKLLFFKLDEIKSLGNGYFKIGKKKIFLALPVAYCIEKLIQLYQK